MILRELKKYLVKNKKVTLKQITGDFSEEPETIEFMLHHWMNKGKVIKKSLNCSLSCKGCSIIEHEYHWLD